MGQVQSRAATTEQIATRTAVLASADCVRRQRMAEELRAMRWSVREAAGGAEAISMLDEECAEVLILDSWLPDLQVAEVAALMRSVHPGMDQLAVEDGFEEFGARTPRRNELLLALRQLQAETAVLLPEIHGNASGGAVEQLHEDVRSVVAAASTPERPPMRPRAVAGPEQDRWAAAQPLPEMVGESGPMRELAWMIRLVARRVTPVLIEGETGSGKELVAKAIHRLSPRAGRPFVVLNCAAIPEALLEAELFGHTRGAFTGAVQSRVGRVEAAHGGTLFLDEIGEMPMALQAKMLRFLECGEIQRVGGNETMRVDVRIVAATHQPLKQRTGESAFRLDLYHRLAVFPVRVPPLGERTEDIPLLAGYFLERLGEDMPIKRLSAEAERKLMSYGWPGNVRELAHVLERATILAEDRLQISEYDIRF